MRGFKTVTKQVKKSHRGAVPRRALINQRRKKNSGEPQGFFCSLSIRRFWGKGERWKQKLERGEGEKRLTQMLLLEPSTPTQHDSIPSNQNHFRSLGCQLHVSKSSPKINLTLRSGPLSGQAPELVLLRFRFFLKPPMRSFRILVLKTCHL